MSYKHLSLEERHYIELSMKNEMAQTEIATTLGRSQSTIYREVSRNKGLKGYRHKQADRLAKQRHETKPKAIKLTDEIKELIQVGLDQDWSPEQMAGRFEKEGIIKLHPETIYQYILADKRSGGDLYQQLRHQNKTYRKRYGSAHNRHGI
ncbi:MAG: IS30 family transposase, partial [Gammaproteobacteria bacterium]